MAFATDLSVKQILGYEPIPLRQKRRLLKYINDLAQAENWRVIHCSGTNSSEVTFYSTQMVLAGTTK